VRPGIWPCGWGRQSSWLADDADRAVVLAELAELIAALVCGPSAARLHLKGLAIFHLGNALRVKGELPQSDEEFRRANALWGQGTSGDPAEQFDKVRVLGMEASLRRAQRNLPEAWRLLDRAIQMDQEHTQAGRLLLKRAKVLEEMDRHEEALEDLRRAAAWIDPEREPRLHWNQRFNSLVVLVHLGGDIRKPRPGFPRSGTSRSAWARSSTP